MAKLAKTKIPVAKWEQPYFLIDVAISLAHAGRICSAFGIKPNRKIKFKLHRYIEIKKKGLKDHLDTGEITPLFKKKFVEEEKLAKEWVKEKLEIVSKVYFIKWGESRKPKPSYVLRAVEIIESASKRINQIVGNKPAKESKKKDSTELTNLVPDAIIMALLDTGEISPPNNGSEWLSEAFEKIQTIEEAATSARKKLKKEIGYRKRSKKKKHMPDEPIDYLVSSLSDFYINCLGGTSAKSGDKSQAKFIHLCTEVIILMLKKAQEALIVPRPKRALSNYHPAIRDLEKLTLGAINERLRKPGIGSSKTKK